MILYRPFESKDLPHLVSVYIAAFSTIYKEKTPHQGEEFIKLYHAALLKGIEGEMFVADQDGTILGFAVIHKESRKEYKFGPIVVLPAVQHQGIGTKLLQLCIDFAQSKRVKQFYLKVHEHNQIAIDFYKKFGFTLTKIFPSDLTGINYLKMVYRI